MSHSEDNKRLAKNTLVLYFRTIIVTIVSLFTSRVLLKNLGVEDYGIYNVVGSIVVLFSFLNSALTTSTQRFLTVALGGKNIEKMKLVFSTSMTIQVLLTILVVVIVESIGPWFLNTRLNIPTDRLGAANIVFQLSILTFALNVLRVPYNATVVAYERLDIFAYISIVDTFCKLLIAYSISVGSADHLVLYSILLTLESLFILLLYRSFCNKKFSTCRYKPIFKKDVFKQMFEFAGWSTFGSFSSIATQNGVLYILNIFCGVVANAAMGIANQVVGALNAFVSSFQTSFYPQIIKAYAQGEHEHLHSLIFRTSKLSYVLMLIPSLVLIVNIDLILRVWLTDVPEYANVFCQMVLVCATIDALTGPYYCGIMATGIIKKYQVAISVSFLIDVVIVYFLLKLGVSPRYVLIPRIATRGIINMLIGLRFLKKQLMFDVSCYVRHSILPISAQLFIVIPLLHLLKNNLAGWTLLISSCVLIVILVSITSYYIIFNEHERKSLKLLLLKHSNS